MLEDPLAIPIKDFIKIECPSSAQLYKFIDINDDIGWGYNADPLVQCFWGLADKSLESLSAEM